MMKLLSTFILFIAFFAVNTFSQNLVINPSFELNSGCPMGPSELSKANNWSDPFVNLVGDTCSTSDYYHSCSPLGAMGVGVPANILGNEPARTGSAYAGIITYSGMALTGCTPMMSDGWREYLQGQLTTPLTAGQQYCVSFWVSLADNVKWASDLWGVHLSPTPVAVNCATVGSNSDLASYGIVPQLTYNGPAITSTNGWTKIQFTYTATGGEQYFVIGNFYNSATTYTCVNASAMNPYAYYYVDDVSITDGVCCDATFTAPTTMCNTDAAVTLTPSTAGGTWSGNGVNSSGVFDPAIAGVGAHTITYTLPCGSSENHTITVNSCVSLSVCKEANGSITVSGGTAPYSWQNQTTTQDCSACLVGCTFPPGCAVNVTTWTTFGTGTNQTPGTYPVQIVDNSGGTILITSAASVTACSADPCASVTITTTITPTQPTCTAAGSAIANPTGGTAPYSYSWNTSPVQTTQTATNLSAGNYTVTVTDNNGCTGTQNVTINAVPNAPTVTITPTQPTCTVAGSAIANPTGGTAPYSYSWNTTPVQTTQTATNLSAGNYTVTVTDNNGCTGTQNVTINAAPSSPTVTTTTTDADCSGTLGTATANVTGGTAPYSYSWNTSPVQTTQTATNLSAGNYTVTVTDNSGCIATTNAAINTSGGTITIQSITPTQPSCAGACDGSLTVVATGGSGTYTYTWKDNAGNVVGTNSATLSNICAGNYTVEVTETGGGSGTQTIFTEDFESAGAGWNLNVPVATEGADPNFFVVNDNEGGVAPGGCGVAGNGDATLHITSVFFPSGGAAYDAGGLCGFLFCPETHRRAESPTINTTGFTGLTLKFDYIANGAIPNDQATVWYFDGATWNQLGTALSSGTGACAPQGIWTAYSQALPVVCENNPNFKIAIRWDNNDDGAGTDPSVAINNIVIESTSGGGTGCPVTQAVTLTDPTAGATPSFTFANFCAGATNGPTGISPTGGTFTFNPVPSDGATINATTGVISNGVAGTTYTVQYTTAGACAQSSTNNVTVFALPQSTISSTDASCGLNDGSATVNVTSGANPLSYSWNTSPVQTTQTANNLAGGSYTVTITDGNSCVNTNTVTVNQSSNITVTITPTQTSCTANTGTATANVTGGTAPYSYSWNTSPVQTTQTAINLAVGNYTVTVTDNAGCIASQNVSISAANAPTASITTSQNSTCFGSNNGTATVSATGGTAPYSYSWSPTGGNNATASNLSPNIYTVTVTDDAGCSTTQQVTITEPAELIVTLSETDTDCGQSNGEITTNATGGTGTYSYVWTPNGETTSSITGLNVGNYSVTVTDANGCLASATGTINTSTTFGLDATPAQSTIEAGGSVNLEIEVENGITIGTIDWTPTSGLSCTDCPNPTASPSQTTTYYVTVVDVNGCSATDSLIVTVKQPCGELYVPTIFSPNGDQMNDLECVMGSCVVSIDFTIFDRWGEIVFHTKDRDNCWDGNFRGKPVQSGVYVYKLVATLENGDTVKESGNINVVR